jgi:ferredoxin-thioredoxin reductase catalytic chain
MNPVALSSSRATCRVPGRFSSPRSMRSMNSKQIKYVRPCASAETSEQEATSKSLEIMRKFSEQYAKRSGTYFCMDKSVTAVVIKGLAEHKDELGAPLCPCRHYDDKQAEADQGFWNCPCVPMRERKECHCMLFLTEDNDFRGDEQEITMDEVCSMTEGM